MKNYFVSDLRTGDEITDFFMTKAVGIKTGSNNKKYLDISVADKSGEINGKKWDITEDEELSLSAIKEGSLVKIKALVSEWNAVRQLRIMRIRLANEGDSLDMSDFVKAAPEDPEKMYDFIFEAAQKIKDSGLRKLCANALSENKEVLLYYPAAKSNHHAQLAGLLYHIKRMLDMGMRACLVYKNLDKDWVTAGIIMHDMEKLNEIISNEYGVSSGYTMKGNLLGHIVMGAVSIQERAAAAGLSEEKTVMLQHMIIAHHNEPEFGSPVRPMFPEAELLHHLDMIDARMFDFEEALKSADPGSFTERIRTLDNRMLYKPGFAMNNREEEEQ